MTETTYLLPVWDTLSLAWEKVKGSKASIWGAVAILFLIALGFGILSAITKSFSPTFYHVIDFIMQIICSLLQMGVLYIGIQRAFDLPLSYSQMFRAFQPAIAMRLIAVYILEVLIILPLMVLMVVGFILFTMHMAAAITLACIAYLGMIYVVVRLSLAMGFVLDKGSNPIQALKESFNATRSNFWRILAIIIIETIIILVSIIPLGIGLIWTIPFAVVLYGLIYKNLTLNNQPIVTSVTPHLV